MSETIETTAIEIAPNGRGLADSRAPAKIIADARERAQVVAKIIEQQHLFVQIKSKRYVKYEGWCTLAAQYGLVPGIESSRPLPTGGFEAKAELRRMDNGAVVSTADAECGTRGDDDWGDRAAYAQRSMAETRAVSKVCRLALSWVIVLAGFDATPAEEVPSGGFTEKRQPTKAAGGTSSERVITIKTNGVCADCGWTIKVGEQARWDPERRREIKHPVGECPPSPVKAGQEAPADEPEP